MLTLTRKCFDPLLVSTCFSFALKNKKASCLILAWKTLPHGHVSMKNSRFQTWSKIVTKNKKYNLSNRLSRFYSPSFDIDLFYSNDCSVLICKHNIDLVFLPLAWLMNIMKPFDNTHQCFFTVYFFNWLMNSNLEHACPTGGNNMFCFRDFLTRVLLILKFRITIIL